MTGPVFRYLVHWTMPVLALIVVGLADMGAADAAAKSKSPPGKKLYAAKTCVACHGRNGNKGLLDNPNLAGLAADYLYWQAKDIAAGKRTARSDDSGHPRTQGMREIMHLVTDDEIRQISDWLGSLDPNVKATRRRKKRKKKSTAAVPAVPPVAAEVIEQGRRTYKKRQCRICHGKEGKLPLKGYPFLAGRKATYMDLQIKDIRDGIRTNGRSKTMVPFLKKMPDEEILAIVSYLSQLKKPTKAKPGQ